MRWVWGQTLGSLISGGGGKVRRQIWGCSYYGGGEVSGQTLEMLIL